MKNSKVQNLTEYFEDYEMSEYIQPLPSEIMETKYGSDNLSELFLPYNWTDPEMAEENITITPVNSQGDFMVNIFKIFPDFSQFPTSGIPLFRHILVILVATAFALAVASFCLKNCFCRSNTNYRSAREAQKVSRIINIIYHPRLSL